MYTYNVHAVTVLYVCVLHNTAVCNYHINSDFLMNVYCL